MQHLCTTVQVLSKALTKAERENATVYLQRVPAFSDLPDIQPYILVKSLPLTDIDAADETLFQTVIPDTRCVLTSEFIIKALCSLSCSAHAYSYGMPQLCTACMTYMA